MEWKHINIRSYQAVLKELEEEHISELDKCIALLAALTGKEISYYNDEIPYPELKRRLVGLNFLNDKPKPIKLTSNIKVGKKRFKFNLNMRSIKASNYVDLSQMVKDTKTVNDNLHKILAVMCEEVNFWGNVKETKVMDRAEFLKDNMNMEYVFSLSGFFLQNYQRLILATNDYLESERRKAMKKANQAIQTALSSIGDGTTL